MRRWIWIVVLSLGLLRASEPGEAPSRSVNLFVDGIGHRFTCKQGQVVRLAPAGEVRMPGCPETLQWVGAGGEALFGLTAPWTVTPEHDRPGRTIRVQNVWVWREGQAWSLLGTLDPGLESARALVPLGGDRFFLVASYGFFRRGDRVAPCCIAKREPQTGIISIEALVDLDFEGPPLRLQPGTSNPQPGPAMAKQYENHYLVKAMQLAEVLPLRQAGDRFVLWSDHFGWFWIFDAKGALQRRACLMPFLTEKDIPKRWNYEWVVLAAQPTADGTLRVAARSQEAVRKARATHPVDLKDPVQLGLNNRFVREDYPEVEWWDLDLETGQFRSVDAPQGAPLNLLEAGGEAAFRFVVKPDGSLAFPNFQRRPK